MAELFAGLMKEEDPTNATAMRDAFERWWGLLITSGGIDADGRLTREEFVEIMKSTVTSPENFESVVMAIADALMSELDTNKDGVLASQEYVQMYTAMGIHPEHSSDAFRRSTVTVTVPSVTKNSGLPSANSISVTTRTLQETG